MPETKLYSTLIEKFTHLILFIINLIYLHLYYYIYASHTLDKFSFHKGKQWRKIILNIEFCKRDYFNCFIQNIIMNAL